MKPDQERVKNLLSDTVSLLCRNGLFYQDELKIEGLIGITLDNNEVFLVPIHEKFTSGSGGNEGPGPNAEEALGGLVNVKSVKKSEPSASKSKAQLKENKTPRTQNSQSSSSSSPAHSTPMKIKQEQNDDDEDLIITKTEDVSSCSYDDSNPRVPPLHGQTLQLPNLQSSFGNFDASFSLAEESDEPPTKKRASSKSGGSSGIMSHNFDLSQGSNSSWSNSGGFPPDVVAQLADGSLSLDQSAGCSSWPAGTPQGDQMSQDILYGHYGLLGQFKARRSPKDTNKPYLCNYPGCGRSFYHRQSLWSHKKGAGHRTGAGRQTKASDDAAAVDGDERGGTAAAVPIQHRQEVSMPNPGLRQGILSHAQSVPAQEGSAQNIKIEQE